MHDDRPVPGVDEPDLDQVCCTGQSDEEHESLVQVLIRHRVVERVEDVVVGNAVPAGAVDDQRLHAADIRCRSRVGNLGCCRRLWRHVPVPFWHQRRRTNGRRSADQNDRDLDDAVCYHNGMAMTLRLSRDLDEALRTAAAEDHRSVHQEVAHAVETYLAQRETEEIKSDPETLRALAEARESARAGDVVFGTEAARDLIRDRQTS